MFVRTDENKVYEIDNDRYVKNGYLYFKGIEKILGGTAEEHKSKIIKQAETIEELVDEFVVCATNTTKNIIYRHNYPIDMFEEYMNKVYPLEHNSTYIKFHFIKCAIWTNEGLIYVAKMNGKGELELL